MGKEKQKQKEILDKFKQSLEVKDGVVQTDWKKVRKEIEQEAIKHKEKVVSGCGKEEIEANYIVKCGFDGLCEECEDVINKYGEVGI